MPSEPLRGPWATKPATADPGSLDARRGWFQLGGVGQRQWLAAARQPGYRRQQIQTWLLRRRATDFQQMTDLPAALRCRLGQEFRVTSSDLDQHYRAADGTEKLLLRLQDGSRIECVLLRDGPRRTVCLSSQVGCAMGCVFCASGLDGVRRNLDAAEIVEQLYWLASRLPEGERLSHIVMMGMGEPLANLDQVLAALQLASAPEGLGISPRRITISTVGLPAAMERLARHMPHYHLAVSLHGPNDRLRGQLVPINRQTGLQAILEAADRYYHASGRRLTFEYVLLAGVNDQPAHARALAVLLNNRPAMINLIPYNPVMGLAYTTPAPAVVDRFAQTLRRSGRNVQVRQRKGDQISAACGQLRRAKEGEPA